MKEQTKEIKILAKSFFKENKSVSCPAFSDEKVIVRQVGKGKKHFWSVIPAWRKIRGKIVNAKGNLADD